MQRRHVVASRNLALFAVSFSILLPEMSVPPAWTVRLRPPGTEHRDGRSLGGAWDPCPVECCPSPGPPPELNMKGILSHFIFCHSQLSLIVSDRTIKHLPESLLGQKTSTLTLDEAVKTFLTEPASDFKV